MVDKAMESKPFSNVQELHEFLIELRIWLMNNGKKELADMIPAVTESVFTTTSEFLGESRNILSKIQASKIKQLSPSLREKITGAIHQIDLAFRKVNNP